MASTYDFRQLEQPPCNPKVIELNDEAEHRTAITE